MEDKLAVVQTQLAQRDPYAPQDFDGAWRLAKIVVASRLAPGLATQEAAFLVLATGSELGLSPMQSIRGIHIIEGRPSLAADTMVALVLRSGRCDYWTEIESSQTSCTIETKRHGAPKSQRATFTIEEAKAAGLVKPNGNWMKYPAVMLSHRCAAILARRVYPDVILALYDPEELVGLPVERAVAPREAVVEYDEPRAVVEMTPDEPPPWAAAIVAAESIRDLSAAANAALKSGVSKADVSPVYEARKSQLKQVAA